MSRLEPVAGSESSGEAGGGADSGVRGGPEGAATGRPGSRMVVDVVIYTGARILLVAATAAVIYWVGHLIGVREFPVVVAVLFAIVLALPLGIFLFAPLRRRATASIAVFDERRRREREELQARLHGGEGQTR